MAQQVAVARAESSPPGPAQPAGAKTSVLPQATRPEAPAPAQASITVAKRPPPAPMPAQPPVVAAPVAASGKQSEATPKPPIKAALPPKAERHLAQDDLLPTTLAASLGLGGTHAEAINRLLPEFPSFDVCAWFEAFEYLRANEERKAFASLALQLNERLNVELPAWDCDVNARLSSLLDFPRITDFLQTLWRANDPALTRAFLVDLLTDNRGGTRNGFTERAATDIAVLIGILDINAVH